MSFKETVMATLLYRIGGFSFRRRRWVLAGWVAVLAVMGGLALSLGGSFSQSFQIPGTESARAQTLLDQRFGAQAAGVGAGTGSRAGRDTQLETASTRLVVASPAGKSLLDGGLKTVLASVAPLAQAPGVAQVSDPVASQAVAPDGSVTYIDLRFTTSAAGVPAATQDQVRQVAAGLRDQGFSVAVTGGPFLAPVKLLSGTESIGVAVALIVLVLTFGSMLAAGMPILTALLGVGIGASGIMAVSAVTDTSSATLALALMLGLAVGIDYSLFLLSRHRQQLSEGLPPSESAARAVGTAGNAVVFAGTTVVIALAALSVVGIPFLTLMGLAGAATVAVSVLLAVTLVPALMGFAGARLAPRGTAARRAERSARADNHWGTIVTRHPLLTLLFGTAVLVAVALPALDLRLALPDAGQASTTSADRQAYDLLARGFGPGFNGPLVALVDRAQGDLSAAVTAVSAQIAQLPDIAYIAKPMPDAAGDSSLVVIIPRSAPNTQATVDLVRAIRHLRPGIEQATATQVWVTGAAAANIDITTKLGDALPVFLLIVVGLAFVLLTVAFRSLLVPLTAVAGFLLSVAAAFGCTVAVYQWGWLARVFNVNQPAPLLSFMPVILVGVLFGLAMDYQVFLVSRMREDYVHGADAQEAVRIGFAHGARVVLAAAIMISVFASFVFGGSSMIAPIAFGLAAGILLDAFVVRMTAIPAIMALVGPAVWWLPRWLDRILPNVDIEGVGLADHLRANGHDVPPRHPIRTTGD
jgi:RND superfamily putative drug exporter